MSTAGPPLSPARLAWRAFWRNRTAVAGMVAVAGFFLVALVGLALTKGAHPVFDPREVRLPDRLKPPLAAPNQEAVPGASQPRLGRYVLGTDELGRDVFARMLEGGFVSLSVGFVAVGIAVALGNGLGVAVSFGVAALAYSYRAHVEEQALLASLGEEYARFLATRKRFIPFLW